MYWQIILDFLLKFMILCHMLDQEDELMEKKFVKVFLHFS